MESCRNSSSMGIKEAIFLNSVPNNDELLSGAALQSAKTKLELALTALAYDPKQFSVEFETNQMGFDWRQKGRTAEFCAHSVKSSIQEYIRVETILLEEPQNQENHVQKKPKFDVTA